MFELMNKSISAIDYLKQTLQGDKLNDSEKVEQQLMQILSLILSNGNFEIYCKNNGDNNVDNHQQQMSELWLKLINEPRIVKLGNVDPNTIFPKFPFSTHVDRYLSLLKHVAVGAYSGDKPFKESGLEGERVIIRELVILLDTAKLNVRLDCLSPNVAKNLIHDIVQLSKSNLGLDTYGNNSDDRLSIELVNVVCGFLWQESTEIQSELDSDNGEGDMEVKFSAGAYKDVASSDDMETGLQPKKQENKHDVDAISKMDSEKPRGNNDGCIDIAVIYAHCGQMKD